MIEIGNEEQATRFFVLLHFHGYASVPGRGVTVPDPTGPVARVKKNNYINSKCFKGNG
ncbi:hypothetical protein [Chlorobium sp. KB01]|uniref:hypothetical protein n=1 Tax=Chlorobium sp. KB01 TaxID=1917528 RepID=UPI001300F609|nr:hypothetical protein [Chlorobium sp. KB01]